METQPYHHRDTSWLAFNHRVLQEAKDPQTPLYERIKFLAIYSSNLDEFYRVRVSALRQFKKLSRQDRKQWLDVKPKREIKQIRALVHQQQTEFGIIFRAQIIPALRQAGVFLLNDPQQFSPEQREFSATFFREKVQPLLRVIPIDEDAADPPFLENRDLHFILEFTTSKSLALLNIPTGELSRFVRLPAPPQQLVVTFLDDIIRDNLHILFPTEIPQAYAIKISRDGELYLDEEYAGDLVERIKDSLEARNVGAPTRLLYDSSMSMELTRQLKSIFDLKKNDLFPGGRYHNFSDFFGFPAPDETDHLVDEPFPPLDHPSIDPARSLLAQILERDFLFHFPYQRYDYIVRVLEEAAADPQVQRIAITLYRVASTSAIVKALLAAVANGKAVTAFVEVKARFDEASNLYWGQALEMAGATVIYSKPKIKVHCKIFLIERQAPGAAPERLAYLGTGNFNEKTARLYADHAVLTAKPMITQEVAQVFDLLADRTPLPPFEQLMVSPVNTRQRFNALIQREMEHAQAGRPAYLILKMNSLEDLAMVDQLYAASQAGVKIDLMVRGICCLQAGLPEVSENITVISIIDRFLEHARVYIFGNGGQEELYLASADWMTRNLDRRVEVVFPIQDPDHHAEIRHIIDLQLADNTKARYIDANLSNSYKIPLAGAPLVRAQAATYRFLQQKGS